MAGQQEQQILSYEWLNADGDQAIYRYDSKDQTYQYYGDDVTATTSGKDSDSGVFGKVTTLYRIMWKSY